MKLSNLSWLVLFGLLLPSFLAVAQDLPEAHSPINPDQVPYLELNGTGYEYISEQWKPTFFQARVRTLDGQEHIGQLFFLSDSGVVLYRSFQPYFPEVFPEHHMVIPIEEIDLIKIRWRQSFIRGVHEAILTLGGGVGAAVGIGIGLNTPLFWPGFVVGVGASTLASLPLSVIWGIARVAVPFYHRFPIEGNPTRFQASRKALEKFTLFPADWPPTAQIDPPQDSIPLWWPSEEVYPLQVSEVSLGLSPAMGRLFQEAPGHCGVGIAARLGATLQAQKSALAQSGYEVATETRSAVSLQGDIQYPFQPHWLATATFHYWTPEYVQAIRTDGTPSSITTESFQYGITLGADYVHNPQDRMMSQKWVLGLGAGLGMSHTRWELDWVIAGSNDQRRLARLGWQPGGYLHGWAEYYFSKYVSLRVFAKGYYALPQSFPAQNFVVNSNILDTLEGWSASQASFEPGLSFRWHW